MGKQKLVMIYDCYFLLSKAESFDCYKPLPEKAKVRMDITIIFRCTSGKKIRSIYCNGASK